MTISDDAPPFTASVTRLPGGAVGLLEVTCAARPAVAASDADPPRRRRKIFNVVFDNSASMGTSTKTGLDAILRPLLRRGWFDATYLTLFDVGTHTYEVRSEMALDHILRTLPYQRRTNITKGIADGIDLILPAVAAAAEHDEDVHVVTMLLTDGGHNEGPAVTSESTWELRRRLEGCRGEDGDGSLGAASLQHTVLAFCLTNSSDATASMIVKEVLETTKIPELPNVFYAATHAEMTMAIKSVLAACGDLLGNDEASSRRHFAEVTLPEGLHFVTTGSRSITHRFEELKSEVFVVTLPPLESDAAALNVGLNWIVMHGAQIPVAGLPLAEDGIVTALSAAKAALEPLARQAVAFDLKAVEARLTLIDRLVDAVDGFATEEKKKLTARGRGATPAARRALLKRAITTQQGVREIRNQVAAIRVRQRSNSDSISLLTGNQRKYAHVASRKSGTEGRTPAAIAADTAATGAKLVDLLRQDAGDRDVVDDAVTAINLMSNHELLSQWAQDVPDASALATVSGSDADEAIMDILSSVGIAAYPVRLETSDATQIEIMQLRVADMCSQLADSASMMASWRLNTPIRFADGKTYTELLLVVDPALPRASTHALTQSMLVQHLLSVMMSKDLFMYLPAMHASMHTHAFAAAVRHAIGVADAATGAAPPELSFLRQAIHIVYSARKLTGAGAMFEDQTSFDRWMQLQTLTRADADRVFHMNALSLRFALASIDVTQIDDSRALMNQLCEHIARVLKPVTTSSQFPTPACFAQRLFGVTADAAPQVTSDSDSDDDSDSDGSSSTRKDRPDPEIAAYDRCPSYLAPASAVRGVDAKLLGQLGDGSATTVREFIEAECLPLYQLHVFSLSLHTAVSELADCGSMDGFAGLLEDGGCVPDRLSERVQELMADAGLDAAAMWGFLGVDSKHEDQVCAAMVMQAALFPDTGDRCGVVHAKDVTDPVEMRRMVQELHMLHYRVAVALKAQQRAAARGDASGGATRTNTTVTAMQAAQVGTIELQRMIGVHTHGHPRREFWAMLRGLLSDPSSARRQQKLDVFRARSSQAGFENVLRKA